MGAADMAYAPRLPHLEVNRMVATVLAFRVEPWFDPVFVSADLSLAIAEGGSNRDATAKTTA